MVRTRNESSVPLIGIPRSESLARLQKLPTVRETLQRFAFLVGEQKTVVKAHLVTTNELLDIWRRSSVPFKDRKNVKKGVLKHFELWRLLKKHKDQETERKTEFIKKLDTLLDISSSTVEDGPLLQFLDDQRNERRLTLASFNVPPLIRGLCFDTTSVNTGRLNGACVNLERLLERELMWLACRHHVLELILAKAFFVCFGPSKSPETPLFKRFREKWPEISKTKAKPLTVTKKFQSQKESVVGFLKTSTGWSRDDYKELIDLTLLVLGNRPEKFSWKKPGPIHHARWMAKLIYAMKIYLLRGQGSAFELTDEEVKKLRRFVRFGALLYVKPWIEAPLAAEAAFNDLELWRKLQDYRTTDPEISTETSTVLERHLWYLSEELVGLAFFSAKLSASEKEQMVLAMRTNTESTRSVVGQPELLRNSSLACFVSKRTANIFQQLMISDSFIRLPPSEWPESEAYQEGQRVVRLIRVINDLAERGVKLCKDFNKLLTKDEDENERVLQVVEQNRKDIKTNCTKTDFDKMFS